MNYYSQNKQFCGDAVEKACGPVSLANSLLLLNQDSSQVPCSQASLPTPGQIIFAVSNPPMKDKPLPAPPLEPWDLTHLAQALLPWPGRAVNRMAHDPMVFCPGDLVYVDRVRLLNCQGKTQYEEAKTSAQIVTVESRSPEGLIVINPGSRIWGRGFRRDMCGSMFIPARQLRSVTHCTLADGTELHGNVVRILRSSPSEDNEELPLERVKPRRQLHISAVWAMGGTYGRPRNPTSKCTFCSRCGPLCTYTLSYQYCTVDRGIRDADPRRFAVFYLHGQLIPDGGYKGPANPCSRALAATLRALQVPLYTEPSDASHYLNLDMYLASLE